MRKAGDMRDVEYRLLAIAAARLRSEGRTQQEISTRLGRSQPEVSRLLTFAEEHKLLARAPSFLAKNVSVEELDEVERRYFSPFDLQRALKSQAPEGLDFDVHVLPDNPEEYAAAAADLVVRLLRRSSLIGLMWGRTVQKLVSQIKLRPNIAEGDEAMEAQCIPLCGDPVHLMNLGQVKYSASHLAAELGQAVNSRLGNQPCLVGVPAYFPRKMAMSATTAPNWESFVHEIPGYREIFGNGEESLSAKVDTIITGMGVVSPGGSRGGQDSQQPRHDETGDFIQERLIQEDRLTEQQLARLVYGDIGGYLIPRAKLSSADGRLVESLNQGWTGITGERFAAVARHAKAKGAPGVIVLAFGEAKAEMALEIVRLGYVNELLVDSSLCAALQSKAGLDRAE